MIAHHSLASPTLGEELRGTVVWPETLARLPVVSLLHGRADTAESWEPVLGDLARCRSSTHRRSSHRRSSSGSSASTPRAGTRPSATSALPTTKPFTPPPQPRHDQRTRTIRETGAGSKFQDRLRSELDTIDARLAEHHNDYSEARTHIDACLNLATDMGDIYASADSQTRRLMNQAFFTQILIGENRETDSIAAKPFGLYFDKNTQQAATERATGETTDPFIQPQVGTSNMRCPQRDSNPH
ncbi:hypothetical protein [Leifsonia xyli]|uniref:hypothetical protein n=1 Tax=Leifsonia xyli TaxID=1575 RepID=UPI0012DD42D1|nr:hypothetical protein [Leifsonia xyli]